MLPFHLEAVLNMDTGAWRSQVDIAWLGKKDYRLHSFICEYPNTLQKTRNRKDH
jgi:hypothetical protein